MMENVCRWLVVAGVAGILLNVFTHAFPQQWTPIFVFFLVLGWGMREEPVKARHISGI
ncbi:hypothetical protein [Veronia nyctiphanis]|uniref:hypothetical protein n=1 Tax=Veronia nyctiphanis TaxID=1278244 RepID=UPI001375C165|nr:hypothetical protein [Veronia nyctiphanis]